jgi:HlyD family secretion protein
MDIARPDLLNARHKKRWVLIVAAVALLAGSAALIASLGRSGHPVPRDSVWIDTVVEGPMVRDMRGTGSLVPLEFRWIAAASGARVERVEVPAGTSVKADTVLLVLSNPDLDEALMSATSAVAAAEADASAKRVALENQLLDLQSALLATEADHTIASMQADAEAELSRRGIVSGLTSKQSRVRADQLSRREAIERERVAKFRTNIAAQVRAEEARLEQLRAVEARRGADVANLQVKAGLDGVVQQVAVQAGQQVAAGTNLARVARPGKLMAQVRIPEFLAPELRPDQLAQVKVGGSVLAARVARIDPAVVAGSVLVDLRFEDDLPATARPDQTVDATVVIDTVDRAVHVGRPTSARAGETTTLYRVSADGDHADRVEVSIGRVSADRVEVLDGLAPGDRVVLSDTRAFEGADRLSFE